MWYVIFSLCSFVTLVMALTFCLCWKKKSQKNDLLGLEGMVTQKNPDENVNHLPSAASHCVVDSTFVANGDSTDASKRNTNNPRRSLPDIPLEGSEHLQSETVNWEPSGDNSSDLYASVDQYQNQAKRQIIQNGIEARPSISQHSSISQSDDAFSPYARVNYEQLRKQEHPYARVQASTSHVEENSSDEPTLRTSLLRHENGTVMEPTIPPRSRRSSAQSGASVDIPAATAVAGGIAANQELPYMTPPIAQTNFSGDSQDSSKGYTSISVREPLANIIAQTKEMNKLKRDLDPHYASVSDDSDDVYTTIPDPNNPVYTSGSETYAQIPPLNVTVEAEINHPVPSRISSEDFSDPLYEPAPQPPSVDSLRQVAHSHSRQASSSSSVANLGSPKPEKRQANSPLPPPPAASPDKDLHTAKNLDDMYAKVHKTKKRTDKDELEPDKNTPKAIPQTSNRSSSSSLNSTENNKKPHEPVRVLKSEIDGKPLHREHNYETLRKSTKTCSDPGYEKIKTNQEDCGSEPGYASINGPDSIASSDPGYEVLKQHAPSEIDPNYEELRHRTSSASECGGYSRINPANVTADGYSVVKKSSTGNSSSDSKDFSYEEPNYESMPSESISEHYAAVRSNGSESDPNYESVSQNDPNYESVKYLEATINEPPYERLNDDDSSKSSGKVQSEEDCTGYETIKNDVGSSNEIDPPYERLNNDFANEKGDDDAGYEKVQKNITTDKNSAESNSNNKRTCDNVKNSDNGDSDDDVIIQV